MDDQLREFVGRVLRIAITLAIVGVIANDGIQVGRSISQASKGMNAAMAAALDAAAKAPDAVDAGQAAAAGAAQASGTALDSYNQTVGDSMGLRRAQVTLSVSAPVGKTVVAAAVIGLIRETPRATWYETPRIALNMTKQVDVYGN